MASLVAWTSRAVDDLREIHDFVARDSERAAEALVERIVRATERLGPFPESGRTVPELPRLAYREVIVGNYRVVYRIDARAVWIVSVIHGRRSIHALD